MKSPSSRRVLVATLAACLSFALQGAAAQRSIKSEAEREAIRAVVLEKDPRAKLTKAEEFLQAYPQSEVRDVAYVEILFAHHKLGETPLALEAGRKAVEINPNSIDGFFNLGVEYLNSEPRDYTMGIWCMARGVALARASKDGTDAELEKHLKAIYTGFVGSEEGLADVIVRAGESPMPPADFHLPDRRFSDPTKSVPAPSCKEASGAASSTRPSPRWPGRIRRRFPP